MRRIAITGHAFRKAWYFQWHIHNHQIISLQARRRGTTAIMEGCMSRRGNCHDNAVAESFFSY